MAKRAACVAEKGNRLCMVGKIRIKVLWRGRVQKYFRFHHTSPGYGKSSHAQAAVDGENLTRHISGFFAGQIDRQRGHFIGRAEAFERH